MNLEELGFTREELQQRIVDQAVENILRSIGYDEDGREFESASTITNELKSKVRERIDEQVTAIADAHVLPKVSELIEGVCIKTTNRYGEEVEKPKTFIEYLTERAEAYMSEPVNYKGKSKKQGDSYNWKANTTRLAFMIEEHLQYSIETSMKEALGGIHAQIGNAMADAVKITMKNVLANVKTSVTVR